MTICVSINANTEKGREEQAKKAVDVTLGQMRGKERKKAVLLPRNDPSGEAIQMLNPDYRVTPGKKKAPPLF